MAWGMAMMSNLYERASRLAPAGMKDLVRRGATRVGSRIGRLPGVELLGAHLAALFARLRINVVLDVGAHVGQYGRFLRNLGYRGHIVSFEPILANFTRLEGRRAGDAKWSAHRLALSNRDAVVPINVTHLTQFSSFLPPSGYSREQFDGLSDVVRTEMVETTRLDGFLAHGIAGVTRPRIFLKLDTQGHDLIVLEGASGLLDRVVALQSEIAVKPIYQGMTGYLEALSALNTMGFELTGLFPVLRDKAFRIVEFDSVMIRAGQNDAG